MQSYSVRLGVMIFNTVITAESEDQAKEEYVRMLIDQDLIMVKKIQPRRIVLEETEKDNFKYTNGFYANQVLGNGIHIVDQPKIWREVKEGERSSTTFRERVINDLVHNDSLNGGR